MAMAGLLAALLPEPGDEGLDGGGLLGYSQSAVGAEGRVEW